MESHLPRWVCRVMKMILDKNGDCNVVGKCLQDQATFEWWLHEGYVKFRKQGIVHIGWTREQNGAAIGAVLKQCKRVIMGVPRECVNELIMNDTELKTITMKQKVRCSDTEAYDIVWLVKGLETPTKHMWSGDSISFIDQVNASNGEVTPEMSKRDIKVVAWNIVSLRRIWVTGWLAKMIEREQPDVVCLSEVKVSRYDMEQIKGWKVWLKIQGYKYIEWTHSTEKKGYAGTCVLSRVPFRVSTIGIGVPEVDKEGRVITIEFDDFVIVSCYSPCSGLKVKVPEKRALYDEKMKTYLKGIVKPLMWVGDLNVADREEDVYDAKENKDRVTWPGFTPEERGRFKEICKEVKLVDAYVKLNDDNASGNHFTWYQTEYQKRKKYGWRLDYVMASENFVEGDVRVSKVWVDQEQKGSDHQPVFAMVTGARWPVESVVCSIWKQERGSHNEDVFGSVMTVEHMRDALEVVQLAETLSDMQLEIDLDEDNVDMGDPVAKEEYEIFKAELNEVNDEAVFAVSEDFSDCIILDNVIAREDIELPHINVDIGGMVTLTMVDTGSTVSLLRSAFFEQIYKSRFCRAKRVERTQGVQLRFGNGTVEVTTEEWVVAFKVGGLCFAKKFLIVESLPVDMLLGNDFVTQSACVNDSGKATITLKEIVNGETLRVVTVQYRKFKANHRKQVFMVATVDAIIPQGDEAYIRIEARKEAQAIDESVEYLVEPLTGLKKWQNMKQGKSVAFGVTQLNKGQTYVKLMNMTEKPAHVRKGDLIAVCKSLSPGDKCMAISQGMNESRGKTFRDAGGSASTFGLPSGKKSGSDLDLITQGKSTKLPGLSSDGTSSMYQGCPNSIRTDHRWDISHAEQNPNNHVNGCDEGIESNDHVSSVYSGCPNSARTGHNWKTPRNEIHPSDHISWCCEGTQSEVALTQMDAHGELKGHTTSCSSGNSVKRCVMMGERSDEIERMNHVNTNEGDRADMIVNKDDIDRAFAEVPLCKVPIVKNVLLDTDDKVLQLKEMLYRRRKVFAMNNKKPGRVKGFEAELKIEGELKAHKGLRPENKQTREIIEEHISNLREADAIYESNEPYAASVVLVKKKCGAMRFAIDYRELNKVLVKDVYPLPRISDALDVLGGSKYYSSVDMCSGYWQIPLKPESQKYTQFMCSLGLFSFKVLPFGIANATSIFSRFMDRVLGKLKWQCALVYVDDILIFSPTFERHVSDLDKVLGQIEAAGVSLKAEKCSFFQPDVTYLGVQVGADGIRPDPVKVKAVQEWKVPETVADMKHFLGLTGYYRKFIHRYADHASPLVKLLLGKAKNARLPVLGDRERAAFEYLRGRLMSDPILAHPDMDQPFEVQTDASGIGLGAVLCQRVGGQEKVIAYISRMVTPTEANYDAHKKEMLCVVWAVKMWRQYLAQREFVLVTDNGAIAWARKQSENALVQRWNLALSEYSMEIRHRPGKSNANCDALSRVPLDSTAPYGEKDLVFVIRDSTEQVLSSDSLEVCVEIGEGGVKSVLKRKRGDSEVVSYASRLITKTEKRLKVGTLRASVAVWAVRVWEKELDGCAFVLRMDDVIEISDRYVQKRWKEMMDKHRITIEFAEKVNVVQGTKKQECAMYVDDEGYECVEGTVIRESTIPGAGRGVITTKAFGKKEIVAVYDGVETENEPWGLIDTEYTFKIGKNRYLNAKDAMTSGKFINMCRSTDKKKGQCRGNNVYLGWCKALNKRVVRTIKAIPENTELFIDYGDCYWPYREWCLEYGDVRPEGVPEYVNTDGTVSSSTDQSEDTVSDDVTDMDCGEEGGDEPLEEGDVNVEDEPMVVADRIVTITRDIIIREQAKDAAVARIRAMMQSEDGNVNVKRDKYCDADGILGLAAKEGKRKRFYVPKTMRTAVLFHHHGSTMTTHMGKHKMMKLITAGYYWPKMDKDVARWCKSCLSCKRRKTPRPIRVGEHMPITRELPFQLLGMDLVVDLPETINGNRHLLTMVDVFTRWPIAIPIPNRRSRTIAEAIYKHLISNHGCPKAILTDQGKEFVSKGMKKLCDALSIAKIETTGYQPQCNGHVERFHQWLNRMLTIMSSDKKDDWDLYVDACVFAYRVSVNEVTGFSPFELVYGRKPILPNDIVWEEKVHDDIFIRDGIAEEYAVQIPQRLKEAFKRVQAAQLEAAQANIDRSKQVPAYEFKEGDIVLIWEPQRGRKSGQGWKPRKFQYRHSKPGIVTEKVGDKHYIVQRSGPKGKIALQKVAINRLSLHVPWDEHKEYVGKFGILRADGDPSGGDVDEDDTPMRAAAKEKYGGKVVNVGDLVVVRKMGDSDEAFRVGKVLEVRALEGRETFMIQWYGNRTLTENSTYRAGYIDGKDNKVYFAAKCRSRTHAPYSTLHTNDLVTQYDVVCSGFVLTRDDKLPANIVHMIEKDKRIDWNNPVRDVAEGDECE